MNMSNYSDLMEELRTEYLEGFEDKFKLMRDFFTQEDHYSLELEYHKLKGTGTTYGVPEVSLLCEKMESLCQTLSPINKELVEKSIELLSKTREKYLDKVEFIIEEDPTFLEISELLKTKSA